LEDAADAGELIGCRVSESDHGNFDDFVLGRVEARCLKVVGAAELTASPTAAAKACRTVASAAALSAPAITAPQLM
jgi:hypothetical protein